MAEPFAFELLETPDDPKAQPWGIGPHPRIEVEGLITDADRLAYAGKCLKRLGNYRVKRVQQIAAQGAPDGVSGALLLCLGLRETGLTNINGGAVWNPSTQRWEPVKTDRGYLQINDHFHREWLKSVPGCPEGSWEPVDNHSALMKGYCPRFTDSTNFTIASLDEAQAYGYDHGVTSRDLVRFAVAAHNAGQGGALRGYDEGNVDKYTALGDYSAWVLNYKSIVAHWINDHPNWKA